VNDLACIKTQKIDKRRELFFSDQAKANTLANSCSYNCVSEKRSFYRRRALIFCGVMALVISLWEYRWINRYLSGGSFAAIAGLTVEGKQTPTIAASILLTIIGIFAFFAVLLRFV